MLSVFPAPGVGSDSRCLKQCNKEGSGAKGQLVLFGVRWSESNVRTRTTLIEQDVPTGVSRHSWAMWYRTCSRSTRKERRKEGV